MSNRFSRERQPLSPGGRARPPRAGNGFAPAGRQTAAADRFVLLPSFHSEATCETLLQTGVGSRADRIAVAYREGDVQFELVSRGRPLLGGALASRLVLDGTPVEVHGQWKSVCWQSDGDGDYLELQLQSADGVRIDRQFLLSRNGHFALIADAVLSTAARRLEYSLVLPVEGKSRVALGSATREGRITSAGRTARVFPLALPQDRVVSTPGSIRNTGGALEIAHVSAGCALYAPVLLDWHPRRGRAPAEWRALTVTEAGETVSADRAAGFRWRSGGRQLLIYRGLAAIDEPRAVLGYHTRYETVVGEFDSAGEVDPIIMVETDESGE